MIIRSSEIYEDAILISMKYKSLDRVATKKYLISVDTHYINTFHKATKTDENIFDKMEIRVYSRTSGKFLSGRTIYSDGRIVTIRED